MLVFLTLTIQMGHCIRDKLTDYWSRAEHFHTTFYTNAMKQERFLHILRLLHFTDNNNEPDMADVNSYRLWKMRNLFDIIKERFSKFYSHLNIWPQTKLLLSSKDMSFSDSTFPRNTIVLGLKFTNCVTRRDTHMI
jgi:hypothetical protein